MSIESIRKYYGIDCKVGQRVRYEPPGGDPREGKIVGTRDSSLLIKLDPFPGMKCHSRSFHPTWCLTFLPEK